MAIEITPTTNKCISQSCPNGNPESKLECPTCSKLKIKGSFFCSQDCFKASWKAHKAAHSLSTSLSEIATGSGTFNPFPYYKFTGALRPVYPLSPRRAIPAHIPRPDYADDPEGYPRSERTRAAQELRILNAAEIEKMKIVCRLGREILDLAATYVKPGVTTDEIDRVVHEATIARNAYPSPLNYRRFPKSVCTSVNEVICHGIPDKRVLIEGDIVNLDVSVYHDGFHSDLNATYPVGKIDDNSAKLIETTRQCLDEAIKVCKPDALFRDIGKAIEPIAKANGCSVVRTYTGHGIHGLFHCPPNIPHYAKNKAVGRMKPGMTFTIEPMINLGPSYAADDHWPDDWTCTTADGQRSAQFEETLLITETGVEVLTAAPGSIWDVTRGSSDKPTNDSANEASS